MRRILVLPIALTCAMPSWAESRQVNDGPWWVGHLVTALAAILGAMMIAWQIGRQRRNEIEAQRENYKIELRLHVYQELSAKLLRASDSFGAAGMYAFCIPQHMRLAAHGELVRPNR